MIEAAILFHTYGQGYAIASPNIPLIHYVVTSGGDPHQLEAVLPKILPFSPKSVSVDVPEPHICWRVEYSVSDKVTISVRPNDYSGWSSYRKSYFIFDKNTCVSSEGTCITLNLGCSVMPKPFNIHWKTNHRVLVN